MPVSKHDIRLLRLMHSLRIQGARKLLKLEKLIKQFGPTMEMNNPTATVML